MKVKFNTLIKLWVLFTVMLIAFLVIGNATIKKVNAESNEEISTIKAQIALPTVKVVKKEVAVPLDKITNVYEFPFETEDKGNFIVRGVSSSTIPNKEYAKMRSNEDVTIFASSSLFEEGTLLWVEGIGIRQVQTVYSDENVLYAYFSDNVSAENFGEKNSRVFQILE